MTDFNGISRDIEVRESHSLYIHIDIFVVLSFKFSTHFYMKAFYS